MPLPVVVENLRHSADILRAGIARDQLLNQLRGNEWTDVGMIENALHRGIQVRLRGTARSNDRPVQQLLGTFVMMAFEWNHGPAEVRLRIERRGFSWLRGVRPASKGMRKAFDCVLIVRRQRHSGSDRLAACHRD